jgi:hypothetical protein
MRMWLACTGALLIMAIFIYLALGREPVSGQGTAPLGDQRTLAADYFLSPLTASLRAAFAPLGAGASAGVGTMPASAAAPRS